MNTETGQIYVTEEEIAAARLRGEPLAEVVPGDSELREQLMRAKQQLAEVNAQKQRERDNDPRRGRLPRARRLRRTA